ncbi:HD domain-containing protein [Brevibacillus fluminis]|uniref:HD domain-containing protein n=1 Tax=Brevibacillus fluminis TaxID=511487 RepID=A0A3M8D5J8_9BACL|nr:HD domain-containing protein [Brevibacillus fluminis]RNB82707.1 HD domain-containing protein [Brevibacillus fluminis]
MERLKQQIDFLIEIDKLKHVFRQTVLIDGSRQENDAEHSWHLAMLAMILHEHANEPGLDLHKIIKMVLIHDLVEIDAGDTFIYDEKGNLDKAEREQAAADRIFAILPADQAAELRALWDEFEQRETAEARFAAVIDRLQPLIHNYVTEGTSWKKNNVTADKVIARNRFIRDVSEPLGIYVEELIADSVKKGYLRSC